MRWLILPQIHRFPLIVTVPPIFCVKLKVPFVDDVSWIRPFTYKLPPSTYGMAAELPEYSISLLNADAAVGPT